MRSFKSSTTSAVFHGLHATPGNLPLPLSISLSAGEVRVPGGGLETLETVESVETVDEAVPEDPFFLGPSQNRMPRTGGVWMEALKVWNAKRKNGGWCVPRKGTADYNEVVALMRMVQMRRGKD